MINEILINEIFFYGFSAIILLSALAVITSRNAVHSAIFLIGTLLGVAGLYLHLHAEFLAGVQVILYVGGIMVLFLFVIMLVSVEKASHEPQFRKHWVIGLTAFLLLGLEWLYAIYRGRGTLLAPQPSVAKTIGNTQEIGNTLFQTYLLPFEVASILLLVAMVGAVIMAKKRI
jgi:NADH-quinone oxidoreductase subunit J